MHQPKPWNDPTFVHNYCARVRTNAHNAHCERPAVQALMPALASKRVLDAGCAGGTLSEWLVTQGAEVIAVDASPLMVAELRTRLGDRLQSHVADLAQPLDFIADGSLDVVVSSLTLHYLKDWRPTLQEFHRKLKPGGTLIFSTHHPMADFRHSPSGDYYAVEYMEEDWNGFSTQPVRVGFYRRPLTASLEALADAGFRMETLVEPKPLPACAESHPQQYQALMTQPAFIVIRAKRN